ncbi:putative cell wall glucanase [Aspergillus ibericus CBS 121593]|uniref:glucan endo-1,3-beta-D-glucosidase n=1 Tax=Aspergillus ibericus CBS 121593 TaxID=1448316 RepID=A0A395GXQ8_9EURO|nr:endo-1,3-beta-glucanase BtgC [Aspergillus ibericus CBS 121593]RAK98843.1 endo-1,3-beta-glucanase BtgC [Aspergillus ibericus CBS 121593]
MAGANRPFSYSRGDDGLVRPDTKVIPPMRSADEGLYSTSYGETSPISARDQAQSRLFDRGLPSVPEGQRLERHFTATPGMDNLGPAAVGGGISGIALGVANSHNRRSGVDAFRETDGPLHNVPAERDFNTTGSDNPYVPAPPDGAVYSSSETSRLRDSYGSYVGPGTGSGSADHGTPGTTPSQRSFFDSPYQGVDAGPYQRHSAYSSHDYPLVINPDDIADDGDDGFAVVPKGAGNYRSNGGIPAAGAGGAAATGGFFGWLRTLFKGKPDPNRPYGAVSGDGLEIVEKGQGGTHIIGGGSRKRGWIVGLVLASIIIGAIVGGAIGGTLGHQEHDGDPSSVGGSSGSDGTKDSDGLLDKNSDEIKALMNNPNLHKVFPGMDYTPWGVQYPLCLQYPPSQNNVTRDLAVLTQLTNTIRLYGTDCNQTEMVLNAIDRLQLTNMKVWLGVWIDTNQTTTDRQISQLYKIVEDANDTSIFKGAIVGNEALYRAGSDVASAETNLIGYINDVKDHFRQKNINLPVGTSDLGDNWNAQLVSAADFVMSNIHPFFGGVEIDDAASWTWTFWQTHDAPLTTGTNKQQIISEVGWPSGGGNDCGAGNKCQNDQEGAVAGIDEMNRFLSDWVCQALDNGTEYFWFEAFDEPWKVQYNTEGQEWEDKWGLMDSARKLKPGLKIPDCGGKTVT